MPQIRFVVKYFEELVAGLFMVLLGTLAVLGLRTADRRLRTADRPASR